MRRLFFTIFVIFSMTILTSYAQEQYDIITSHPRVILSKEVELSLQFLFLESEDANTIKTSLQVSADKLVEGDKVSTQSIEKYIKENNLQQLFYDVSTLAMG